MLYCLKATGMFLPPFLLAYRMPLSTKKEKKLRRERERERETKDKRHANIEKEKLDFINTYRTIFYSVCNSGSKGFQEHLFINPGFL